MQTTSRRNNVLTRYNCVVRSEDDEQRDQHTQHVFCPWLKLRMYIGRTAFDRRSARKRFSAKFMKQRDEFNPWPVKLLYLFFHLKINK